MSRIRNSIALAKASWQVLKADKELMLLPLISMAATTAPLALFFMLFLGRVDAFPLLPSHLALTLFFMPDLTGAFEGASILLLVVMYFVLAYITLFFNAALVSAAHQRLEGGDPTVGSALRGAASRAGPILPWAFISAVVSTILKTIEEQAGSPGSIVITMVGVAWSVVTFLVLPIIVIEGKGAMEAIKGSVDLFPRTWGENLGARVGLNIVGYLAFVPGVALIALAIASSNATFTGWSTGWSLILGLLWILAVIVVMSALSGIFQTALYYFAVDGQAPSGYFDN